MRFLSILFICCFLTTFSAQGQLSKCPNSIFTNGNLENGTPTTSHQDIGNAVGFSRIWAPGSWADYYPATYAPAGYPTPSPATGDYASCWIANYAGGGTTYREGFQAELDFTVPANTGTYTLTFDAACLGGWGNSEVAVYALHNPSNGDAPNPPTGAFTPSNLALFGTANTQLINVIPVSASTCSNTKTNYSLTINTNVASFPAGGMTHIFVTHSDNSSKNGAIYMAFDNFCMPVKDPNNCPASWVVNGHIEDGTPSTSHQDIHLATGFDRIWNGSGLSYADYYPATYAPAGYPTPNPASGDYASCWIANYAGGGTTYREGFQTALTSTIPPNTGMYQLTFDVACLGGWGNVEIAAYGINNPSSGYSANPTGAYTPSNIALFGAANTVLLGTVPVNSSNCSSTKTQQTVLIDSDAAGFPAGGMTHFFVTHSDNSGINGARYIAFDNFCLQSRKTLPCPVVNSSQAECGQNGSYVYTITTSNTTGTVTLSSPCGTFSPSTINLTGATSYSVTFTPNGACSSTINVSYSVSNSAGVACDNGTLTTTLPDCGCQCDEDFLNGFMNFLYAEDCPNDIVRPAGVDDDCDRIEWHIDGNYVGSSTGTNAFSFPHSNNSFVLCMTVIRTTASGEVCKRKVCREITPRTTCGIMSPMRLNVTPNPATTQVAVSWNSPKMPDNVSITIFNSSSIPVKVLNDVNSFDGNAQINIADLPTGMYYISVEGEGYVSNPVKFIKK